MDSTAKLREQWNNGEPDAEWSTYSPEGHVLYYAAYSEGIVLRLGDGSPIFIVAELARRMAARVIRDFGPTKTGNVPFSG